MFRFSWRKPSAQSSIQHAGIQPAAEVGEQSGFRCVVLAMLLAMSSTLMANDRNNEKLIHFDIPQQRADLALTLFAEQADLTLIFPYEDLRDKTANRLVGAYSIQDGAEILLEGTGLKPEFSNRLVMNIAAVEQDGTEGDEMEREEKKGILAGVAAAVLSVFGGQNATGQETGEADATRGALPIEEIIVTAQKRSEGLQDTAMSLSVLSSTDIEQRDLRGMSDYLVAVPGVSHLAQGVGRNATVIRGVSVNPQSEGNVSGQTVGVYFGEVPLSGLRWSAADIKLVDMDHVEVLRGPQGTLYGAGSLSGAVRNIPMAPNLAEFQGSVGAGYSNTARNGSGSNEWKGVINLPLKEDTLAIRLVGYHFDDAGYVRNVAGSDPGFVSTAATWGAEELAIDEDDVGQAKHTGGRVTALWRPTDALSATLTYLSQDSKQTGFPEIEISTRSYVHSRLQMGDVIGGGSEMLKDNIDLGNLVINYDFAWGTLQSSTSYSEQVFDRHYDIGIFFSGQPTPQIYIAEADGFTEEVRLVSQLDGPFQFLTGLYYEDQQLSETAQNFFGGDPVLNPFDEGLLGESIIDSQVRQRAAFGEVSFDITAQLRATVGARAFDYDRSNVTTRFPGPFFGAGSNVELNGNESNASYKANLRYTPRDGSLIYAQWSQGFRLGKPISTYPATCDQDSDGFIDGIVNRVPISGATLDSDYLDSYELGGKFALLDNRLVVNIATFQIDWTGLPVSIIPPCLLSVPVNAGKAKSRGIELETWIYLTPRLRLSAGASLIKAELNGDAPSVGADGDRLPGSPEQQFSLGVHYTADVAGLPTFFRTDYACVGSFYNRPGEAGIEAGDYGLLSANFGISLNQFEFSVFGSNLTNSDAVSWVDSVFPDGRAFRLQPRTIGLSATYRF